MNRHQVRLAMIVLWSSSILSLSIIECRSEEPVVDYVVKFAAPETLIAEGKEFLTTINLTESLVLIRGYEYQIKQCMDVKQSWGMYGNWGIAAGAPVYCFPTTDTEKLVELLALSGGLEWELDEEAKVYRIGADLESPDLYVKETESWSFGCSSLEGLESTPSDPSALFGLQSEELLVAEVVGDSIGEEAIDAFIEIGEAENEGLRMLMSPAQRRAFDAQSESEAEQLREIAALLGVVRGTIGIDKKTKALQMSFDVECKDGADLSGFVGIAKSAGRFSGFKQGGFAGGSITLDFESDSSYAEYLRSQIRTRLQLALEQQPAEMELPERDGYSPNQFPQDMADAMLSQIDQGRFDFSFSILNEEGRSTAMVGGEVHEEGLDKFEEACIEFLKYFESPLSGGMEAEINGQCTGDVR